MWVKSQNNEGAYRVDSMFIAKNKVLTIIDDELLELGVYDSETEAKEVLDKFWTLLLMKSKAFKMP